MIESEWIEYRGVRARVTIEDSEEDIVERYATVTLYVEGRSIAATRTDGSPYDESYSMTVKADPIT